MPLAVRLSAMVKVDAVQSVSVLSKSRKSLRRKVVSCGTAGAAMTGG